MPGGLAGDRVLKLTEVAEFKLPCQGLVVVHIKGGILLRRPLDALLDLLANMGRQLVWVAIEGPFDNSAQAKFDPFHGLVELTQLRRQVEPLLDEEILYRLLEGTLALGDEIFEVLRSEGIPQQDRLGRGRDEVRTRGSPERRNSPLLAMSSGR